MKSKNLEKKQRINFSNEKQRDFKSDLILCESDFIYNFKFFFIVNLSIIIIIYKLTDYIYIYINSIAQIRY